LIGVSFHVRAWSAWAPGLETTSARQEWAGQSESRSEGDLEPVPVLLRRRVSPIGQKALKAAWSLPDSGGARMVFCSRHGEFGRTLSILDSLVNRTPVSPADFTLSVHNALAGLLSIARGNRQGHTTIAAGLESFGMGMLEAIACLQEQPDEPVVLVYFDENLPAPFDIFDQGVVEPIALAMTLTATDGERFTLKTGPAGGDASASSAAPFLRLLRGLGNEATVTGEQLVWHWRRDHADH
jgi:hypothetical protein